MKRVLYYSPSDAPFEALLRDLDAASDVHLAASELGHVVACGRREFELVHVGANEAMDWLAEHYAHLVVVDMRQLKSSAAELEGRIAAGLGLLDRMDSPTDIEARYGFHRILALVSGADGTRIDNLLVKLGAMGVGHVLRQRPADRVRDPKFARSVFDTAAAMIERRDVGKTALAASGGGITGIYFELGALKCLDDVLSCGVNSFDMYFGISAGAVVAGVIAAGYSVDEFMAALVGAPGGRIGPLDLRLFRLGHLNMADMRRRALAGLRTGWTAAKELLKREPATLDGLLLDYTALVGPPFRSDMFEEILRELLDAPGATNDFRELRRPLFIGASDQDARGRVLFGAQGYDHVPISKAIQASLSIHPAFSAVNINGRWYEDGAVTRTSDFVEAIERGADLIFVLDPFVPYIAPEAGSTNRRGILYNIDQDIRSLSFTRFENTRNWVLRQHPEVSSYTFLPSNPLRRVLSANPMDHRPFLEIWRGAYISTYQRLVELCHRLRGDLIAHGITVNTDIAEEVSARLEGTPNPTFADFFPDRQVAIKRPPLARE